MSSPTPVTLRCGASAVVRELLPADAPALAAGMKRLSPASRQRRFLHQKDHLTDAELERLTTCDGVNHIGVGLALTDRSGREVEGLAVARCFRDAANPLLAEASIVILDEWQSRGIGSILARALAERAWEVGIRYVGALLLAENLGARKLLERVATVVAVKMGGRGTIEATYALCRPL